MRRLSKKNVAPEYVKIGYTGPAVETWTGHDYAVVIVAWGDGSDRACATVRRFDGGVILHKTLGEPACQASPPVQGGNRMYMYSHLLLHMPEGPVDYTQFDEGGVV